MDEEYNFFEDNSYQTEKSQKTKTIILSIVTVIILVGMIVGAGVGGYFLGVKSEKVTNLENDLVLTGKIYDLIEEYYYEPVDKDKYDTYAAMGLSQVMDKYSGISLMYAEEKLTFGFAMYSTGYNRHFVSNVEKNSPVGALLHRGDEIVSVNGVSVTGMDKALVSGAGLLGNATCTIQVRTSTGELKEPFTVNKGKGYVHEEARYFGSEVFGSNVGMIQLDSFTGTAAEDFALAAQEFRKDNNAQKLILDLRGNGGGSTTILSSIATYLIKDGDHKPINKIVDKKGGENVFYSDERGATNQWLGNGKTDYQLAVLMDGMSASASEALMGALLYYEGDRVQLIGSPSYGKGIAQTTMPIKGYNLMISITTGYFYVPSHNATGETEWITMHEKSYTAKEGFEISKIDNIHSAYDDYYGKYYNNNIINEIAVARAVEYLTTGK